MIERLSPTQAEISSFPQSKPAALTKFILRCPSADSLDVLWVNTSAVTNVGHDAAMQRFQGNRRGAWTLERRRAELRVVEINPGTAPPHTPLMFTFAPPADAEHPLLIKWRDFLTRTDAG